MSDNANSGSPPRLKLSVPVIVEGKYDKARLAGILDAVILTTDGFSVFRNRDRQALIRRLGANGIVLLSDSDGGGRLIRSHLRGMLTGIEVWDLYVPAIPGKEPRKRAPSKAGILGVEGVPDPILRGVFEAFLRAHPSCGAADGEDPAGGGAEKKEPVTRTLLYELGLSGGTDAARKRDAAAEALGLPRGMTANGFFAAASMLTDAEGLKEITKG